MAIELKFSKPDGGLHWGFRLVGGADFKEPLVVVKVNEDSLAEKAGLMVGDVVVRINNLPTSGLTHVDAHNLINQAGCDFLMAIRRGLFSDIPVDSEENGNAEIEDIFNKTLAENFEGFEKVHEIGPTPRNLENLAGQEQVLEHVKVNNSIATETSKPKKWSTFLVKPKNPKPLSKKLESERTIIGEPYKVKIVKQPRRDPNDVLYRKKSVQFEPLVTEVEISRDTSIADSTDSLEMSEEAHLAELEIETSIKISEETTVEIREADDDDDGVDQPTYQISDNESPDGTNENEDQCTIKKITKPILRPACLDIHIDPVVCESSLSLEEQLAAVQKQLLTLSQLPSAIQVTLEAVTQQLNKIVLEKTTRVQENGYEDYESRNRECTNGFRESFGEEEEEDIPDENVSVSENAEGDITENEADDQPSFDDLEHDHEDNVVQETQLEETEQAEEPAEIDPYAGLTEEEKEAKIREEKLLSKKQKIEEERRKMDWTQRPIVLPGGRKWSDPDDATPKLRTPKMSDEKICKAIEDHSELIVGKTKGINFLKYQPPPKNLDYLQKSEVYRLIHDMEPPVRGVGARAEIILSEKDYYQDRGAP